MDLGLEEEGKSYLMYIAGCALILNVFVIEHIPVSGTCLTRIVSLVKLKWDATTKSRSLSATQAQVLSRPTRWHYKKLLF